VFGRRPRHDRAVKRLRTALPSSRCRRLVALQPIAAQPHPLAHTVAGGAAYTGSAVGTPK
jgi:hypothetical protein